MIPETHKFFEEKLPIPPDFKPELLKYGKKGETSWFGGVDNKFLEKLKTFGSIIFKKIPGTALKKTEVQKEEVVISAEDQHRRDVFWSNPETDIIMDYLWTHPEDEHFRRSVDVYIDADISPEIAIQNLQNNSDFENFILNKEDDYAFPADWSAVDVVRDYIKTLDIYGGANVQGFYDNLVNRKYYSPEQVVKIMSHKFSGFRDYLEEKNNPARVLEKAILDYRSEVSDYTWRDLIDSFVALKDLYGDSTKVIEVLFNNFGSLSDRINSLGANFDIEMVYNTLVKIAEAEKKKIIVKTMGDFYALEKYVPEHLREKFKQRVKDLENNVSYYGHEKVDMIKSEYPTIAKVLEGKPIDPKELEYQTTPVREQYFWPEEEVEIDLGRDVAVGIEAVLKTSEKEAENAAHFISGLLEAVHDEEARTQLEDFQRRARILSEETLFKIKELGSTRDGWYEHEATKERWYLKMHQKEQTRAEFLANILYEKLGVKVAKTKLFRMRGNITLGSLEIPDALDTTNEEQRTSADIRSGFIADAFLGNLDVVGGSKGNIVKGKDGHFYRVGNGKALGFGTKNRKSSLGKTIPELESMLDPKTPAGKVFEGLTETELKQQARNLIESLSSIDIQELIQASGITGKKAVRLLETLLARREFLMQRFELKETNPKERLASAITEIERIRDKSLELGLLPRVGFIADGKAIESQMIDVIENKAEQKIILDFKLTADFHKTALENIKKMRDDKSLEKMGYVFGSGTIVYKNINENDSYSSSFELCGASVITAPNGVEMKIALPAVNNRSALGLVNIEIPRGENAPSLAESQNTINKMLEDVLGIKEGLSIPEEQAERDYKQARYVWHHKLDEVPDEMPEIQKRLKREEVFPGYQTIVEPGKHREYEAVSDFAVYHDIQHAEIISKIIRAGGLLCTRERYRRGMMLDGMSSPRDLERGGADSVFTRIVTQTAVSSTSNNFSLGSGSISFVFDHSLLDRTDWYAYHHDTFGNTEHSEFRNRQSPEQLFEKQKTDFNSTNEQMFRLGISLDHIKAFVVSLRSFHVPVILDIFKINKIEIVDEEGTTPIELIVKNGIRAAKEVLKKNGIEYYNDVPVDQIVEKKIAGFFEINFFDKMTEHEWGKIGYYNDDEGKWQFRRKSFDEQIQELRVKGLKFIGEMTIEEAFSDEEFNRNIIIMNLRNNGVYYIGGTSPLDYFCDFGLIKFKEEARKIFEEKGIKILGKIISLEDTLERARQEAVADLKSYLSARSILEVGGASVEELAKEGLYKFLDALKKAKIEKLGGTAIADLSDDTLRDVVIRQLKEAGIEEINGRPVEEMVVYGYDFKDLIDISHDRKPKLGVKDKVDEESGDNGGGLNEDKIVD